MKTKMLYPTQCALQVYMINESVLDGRHPSLAIALKTYKWLKIEYLEAVKCARKAGYSTIALKTPKINYNGCRASLEVLYGASS